jgi:hypothetical protein
VKATVGQFMERAYYNSFDALFILMLARKQASYSQRFVSELLNEQFSFSSRKHIIDLGDLLGEITRLRPTAQERVLAEFKHILGEVDAYISVRGEADEVEDFLADIDADRGNGGIHGLLLRLLRSSLGRRRGGSSRSIP